MILLFFDFLNLFLIIFSKIFKVVHKHYDQQQKTYCMA